MDILQLVALRPENTLSATFQPASQLYLEVHSRDNSLALNLHIRAQRQLLHSNTSATRLDIAPVRLVHVVHAREVLHVGQEDVDFENVLQAGFGGFEHGGEVADALVLEEGEMVILGVRVKVMMRMNEGLRCDHRRSLRPFCRFWG